MTGNELITITIEDGDKRISTRYCVLDADRFNGTKGEYHLLALDNLINRFDSDNTKRIDMTKPIGATQQQLDEHNIEWVLCGNYGHRDTQEPKWALRHSSEYEWAKERTMLLQEIANLRRQVTRLEDELID